MASGRGIAAGRRPCTDGLASQALLAMGRFFTRWDETFDDGAVFRAGGRAGDVFYRDRWSHDKVVRSTHGVNCTGSCSWKVYVKDGIITWESQETDYPSVGPDRPEYEPRGCPRGAAFSWYTYSPTRVRYPYARGVLVEMYREAKQRLGDPVLAWADVTGDPERRRRYQQARGHGGLVRVSWAEAVELVAAAHVNTIKTYGADRCAGFSPIPAMSMVSHCVGTRFIQLIGGVMTSFYDWYADLPVASPQVFGDQTDVPESGDWWDATYLMMWGSNVPVTRTPDAHWMAEVRYRGTKVVTVSPDHSDNTKFADEWLPAEAGTDAALAMAMGHVILTEFFVGRQTPFFADYVRRYTDLPFVVRLEEHGEGGFVPAKFLTAADLPGASGAEEVAWKTVVVDAATGRPAVPNGSMGFRYAASGEGRWNLLGIEGMARRYADYLPEEGFQTANIISTFGAFLLGASTLPFLYNVWKTWRYAPLVETDDPCGYGGSLEWATSCPPPRHNFDSIPRIRSERPAFDLHHPEVAPSTVPAPDAPGIVKAFGPADLGELPGHPSGESAPQQGATQ